MSLLERLLEKPTYLPDASKFHAFNGTIYLATGVLLVVWPSVLQTLLREPAFVGREEGLIRAIGLLVIVIGWHYLFGGGSGAPQVVAAGVIDRLLFVPIVLLPLAFAGVFPRLMLLFTCFDVVLAAWAWVLINRMK